MNTKQTKSIIMVSACLLGITCRYDGKTIQSLDCKQELDRLNVIWIPFCPEQLGGLPTPRPAANINEGNGEDVLTGKAKVLTKSGVDVTESFILGAEQVLAIAEKQLVTAIFLKARSPSCGVSQPSGVTAALLARHGYKIYEFN